MQLIKIVAILSWAINLMLLSSFYPPIANILYFGTINVEGAIERAMLIILGSVLLSGLSFCYGLMSFMPSKVRQFTYKSRIFYCSPLVITIIILCYWIGPLVSWGT